MKSTTKYICKSVLGGALTGLIAAMLTLIILGYSEEYNAIR